MITTLALSLVLALTGCGSSAPQSSATSETTVSSKPTTATALQPKDVSIQDLDAARAAGARIIDVRTAEEFASGHVPGAQNFPIDELDPMSVDAWSKDAPLYLICEKGGRSRTAAEKLAAAGYDARNVVGGTSAWRDAGLPVEK